MRLAAALAFLCLAACGPSAATSKIAGIYVGDTTAPMEKTTPRPDGTVDSTAEHKAPDQVSLRLGTDGTAHMKIGNRFDQKGIWKLDGDKLTLASKDGTAMPVRGKVDNDTITLTMNLLPGSRAVVLHKK